MPQTNCQDGELPQRQMRSYLNGRDPSVDRGNRPCPNIRARLFGDISEDSSGALATSSEMSEISSATENGSSASNLAGEGALVYLRLRPVEEDSPVYALSECKDVLVVSPPSESSSTSNNKNTVEKHYGFTGIFDDLVEQKEVYNTCIFQKIKEEENFTILTYGTSGSGKTFTLLGDDENPGIIPRSLEHIFSKYELNILSPALKLVNGKSQILDDNARIKETRLRARMLNVCPPDLLSQQKKLQLRIQTDHSFERRPIDDVSVYIWISFAEIYNELVYDLLEPSSEPNTTAPTRRKNLKVIGSEGTVFVKGLTSIFVKSSLEALQLLRYGRQRAIFGTTCINANSSRSHCIFFVDILKYHRSGVITSISYKFCDLAGSERVDKTGNVGSRLKETQRINTSLMVLGRCIDAANSSRSVIPYRESKLTMLLQAALLGKDRLTMIVNLTPNDKYYEENLNVLGFSSIAKNIVFKEAPVKQNSSRYSFFNERGILGVSRDETEIIAKLHAEIDRLRNDLVTMQQQHRLELVRKESEIRNKVVDAFEEIIKKNSEEFDKRLQRELSIIKRTHEATIASLKRQHENDLEDLREELEEKYSEQNKKTDDVNNTAQKRSLSVSSLSDSDDSTDSCSIEIPEDDKETSSCEDGAKRRRTSN